jgi:hypothetical protein
MIDVVMADQQRLDLADLLPVRCHALLGPPAADARIDEQARASRLHENAVAVAAALTRKGLHGGTGFMVAQAFSLWHFLLVYGHRLKACATFRSGELYRLGRPGSRESQAGDWRLEVRPDKRMRQRELVSWPPAIVAAKTN